MDSKDTKALVWTIGAQMIALAISLLVVFLIVITGLFPFVKKQKQIYIIQFLPSYYCQEFPWQ